MHDCQGSESIPVRGEGVYASTAPKPRISGILTNDGQVVSDR